MKVTQCRLRHLFGAVLFGLSASSLCANVQNNQAIIPQLSSELFASNDRFSWRESVLEDFRNEVGTDESSFVADEQEVAVPYEQAMEAWAAMNSVMRDLRDSVNLCINPEACNWPMPETSFEAMLAALHGASGSIESAIATGTVNAYCVRTDAFLLKQLLDLIGKNKTLCPVLTSLQESYLVEAVGHLDFATTILGRSAELSTSSINYPSNLTQVMGYVQSAMDNIQYAFFDGYEPEWVASALLQDGASVVNDSDAWSSASLSGQKAINSLNNLPFFKHFDHFRNPLKAQAAESYATMGILYLEAAQSTVQNWLDGIGKIAHVENPITEKERAGLLNLIQQGAAHLAESKKYALEDNELYYLSEGILYSQAGASMIIDASAYMDDEYPFYSAIVNTKQRTQHAIEEVKKAF